MASSAVGIDALTPAFLGDTDLLVDLDCVGLGALLGGSVSARRMSCSLSLSSCPCEGSIIGAVTTFAAGRDVFGRACSGDVVPIVDSDGVRMADMPGVPASPRSGVRSKSS